MRYSILGFSQEQVLSLQDTIVDPNTGKSKIIRIDATDLLILRDIADFMNRRNVVKYIIDEKTFFNVKYSTIIEDLPLLNLKQQALSDRLNKLCYFELLEKAIVKNQTGSYTAFRIGKKYEECVYNNSCGTSIQIHSHKYLDTSAKVSNYKCYNNIILNNSSTINSTTKKEDTNVSFKKDDLFEECWIAYRRKGSKKKAKEYWQKLKDNEKETVLSHIKAYVSSREIKFQKDFERYLRDKIFTTVVYQGSKMVYDPTQYDNTAYTPQGRSIWYDENTKTYWSDDNFYYGVISDGYTDDNRPDGARIMLNNGRGYIHWSSEFKEWLKD